MTAPGDDNQPLQFETAIPRSVPPPLTGQQPGVLCAACQQMTADEYFDVNGQSVCAACRSDIELRGEPARGSLPLARAALFGFGAAIAGAVLYYAVVAITNFEIGLVAIAIGYMVGYAIRTGAGGRGGRTLQVLAIVLTYWAVGLAYVPIAFTASVEESQQAAAADPASPASSTEPAAADAAADDQEFSFTMAAASILFLSFALPVLVVAGSLPGGLISAAIIGFGMHQAWRMTAAPQLTITGPYRVGTMDAAAS
jgi:hypothetical protein